MSLEERTGDTAPHDDGPRYEQELSRSLTFKENVLITLSAVTPASSVFIIVPPVIQQVGGAAVVAFLLAAVAGVFMAFCYAELSSRYPLTGGEYAFAARTLGPATGFALFTLNMAGGIFILAVVALGTGDYLGEVWHSLGGQGAGVAVVLLAAVVAVFNIRTNAWVTGVFLAVELAALAALVVLGFVHVDQPVSTLWTAQAAGGAHGVLTGVSWGLVAAAVATALFAYNGYGAAVYFAEETRNAGRTIGRSILWSLAITVAAEVIPLAAVLLGTPSLADLVGSAAPMNHFLLARGGSAVNTAVSLGIALAVINAVIALMLQQGRLLYSAARDGAWPDVIGRPMARVHARLKTPVAATLTVGVASALIAWLVPAETLLLATGANLLVLYAVVALSALRGKLTGRTRTAAYQMPGGITAPLAILAVILCVTYETVVTDWVPAAVSLSMFAAGYLYYYGYLRTRRDERWTLPEPVTEEE
ncbi:APC family permease [Streptomyces sp. NRRL F-5053]|uniref:APC family permease n=1 Tax=Streptomyces sp. NRRL F-5053 TaxID=1463854 RepID=UPI00055AE211|nr:APC family permease [Streptomyces sp. NRRL F-5053]